MKLCGQLEAVCAAAIEAALEDNAEQMMQWASERVAAIQAAAGSKSTDKLEVTLCELHTTEAHLGEVTDELRAQVSMAVSTALSSLAAAQLVLVDSTAHQQAVDGLKAIVEQDERRITQQHVDAVRHASVEAAVSLWAG